MSIGSIGSIGAGWEQLQAQAMRQAMFKQMDQDRDGSISKGDLQAVAQNITQTTGASINVDQVFSTLDANQDGVIDQSEYDSAMQQFASAMHHHGGVHGLGHHHSQGSQQTDASSDPLQALFQQLDQDGDGKISQSEFQTGLQNLTQTTGTGTGNDQTTTQAASSATGLENSTTALTQKLLQDFIFMVQNDAYFQTSSGQKGVEAYA
jgi:Ca2+-binding EF-hand superfamily protein